MKIAIPLHSSDMTLDPDCIVVEITDDLVALIQKMGKLCQDHYETFNQNVLTVSLLECSPWWGEFSEVDCSGEASRDWEDCPHFVVVDDEHDIEKHSARMEVVELHVSQTPKGTPMFLWSGYPKHTDTLYESTEQGLDEILARRPA